MRGPPVGAREGKRALDPRLALLREDLKDPEEGQDEDACPGGGRRGEGDEEARGGEQGVDQVDLAQLRQHGPRGDAEPVRDAQRGGGAVDHELRGEREEVDRPVRPFRRSRAERQEDHHGPDRVPGIAGAEEGPVDMDLPASVVRDASQEQSAGNGERNHVRRQQEKHRDEDELRGIGPARGDPELNPGGQCVRGH